MASATGQPVIVKGQTTGTSTLMVYIVPLVRRILTGRVSFVILSMRNQKR